MDNNIIAEFTRFNPLIKNENFSKGYLDIIYNRPNVYIDLNNDYSLIYKNYKHSVKSNIKKAQKDNITIKIFQNDFPYKKEFIRMYNKTMERVNAPQYIFFNKKYFEDTFNSLPLIHFVLFKNNIPISTALCLGGNDYLHVHFEASEKEFWNLRPNDLLINEIVKYGIQSGYSKVLLGGGRTTLEDDALLRFKKKFSNQTSAFYIGSKIYNINIYNKICNIWANKYPKLTKKYNNFILKYRMIPLNNIYK